MEQFEKDTSKGGHSRIVQLRFFKNLGFLSIFKKFEKDTSKGHQKFQAILGWLLFLHLKAISGDYNNLLSTCIEWFYVD